MSAPSPASRNLIVVAGHAPFKEQIERIPENPEQDDAWVLQPFQRGEPPLYIAHIRRGVELLRQDSAALLIFSGGFTRKEAGLHWSEAATYLALARHFDWWEMDTGRSAMNEHESRTATEDYSRDSFENLLFSICRFQQVAGAYPDKVTLVSWAFKGARFDLHRAAIRYPANRFRFHGCDQPLTLEDALKGEAGTMREFEENKFGASRANEEKRARRNPWNRRHNFERCPGLGSFFEFINDPQNGRKDFPDKLPWEMD